MPKKTNFEVNGKNYFKVTTSIGFDSKGNRIHKVFYGNSKKEAEDKRDSFLKGTNKGLDVKYDITFNNFFCEWFFEVKKPSVADSTFNRYESLYRIYIKASNFF
jgi:integrase